ncbi:hypothetical protein AVEN_263837-1 [Araneus ventricosus]|uniref:Uncharacterized protein n=1 Tax=Araneus ventricosus TaxID=182803 RepID=A0A4Y2E286_ARAVE|nr:hypothetical protein AVEN_263837-1 [Araneus ventricosus]
MQMCCARTVGLRIYTSAFVSSVRAATQQTVSTISFQRSMSLLGWIYSSTAEGVSHLTSEKYESPWLDLQQHSKRCQPSRLSGARTFPTSLDVFLSK